MTALLDWILLQGGTKPPPSGEPWKTVTEAQLRHWTGNFCGPALSMIAPACPQDPVTQIRCATTSGKQAYGLQQGVCFSTHLLNYTEAQQDEILANYHGSHFPFNCTDDPTGWGYSGIFPPCPSGDPVLLNAALKKIWRAGKIPVCVILGYHDKNTDEAWAQFVKLLDDPLLVRIVLPGMEMNEAIPDRAEIAKTILRAARYLPWALIYVEWGPGHGAGDSPEPDWYGNGWRADEVFYDSAGEPYTHGYDWPGYQNIVQAAGLLINDANFNNAEKLYEETGNWLIRLQQHGYWGLRRTIDSILFETVAIPRFWDNRDLASCDAHNQLTLDECYYHDYTDRGITARLAGYCNYSGR
jgi:hypothetical protein